MAIAYRQGEKRLPIYPSERESSAFTYYPPHNFHAGVTNMKEGHHLLHTHLTSPSFSLLVLLQICCNNDGEKHSAKNKDLGIIKTSL